MLHNFGTPQTDSRPSRAQGNFTFPDHRAAEHGAQRHTHGCTAHTLAMAGNCSDAHCPVSAGVVEMGLVIIAICVQKGIFLHLFMEFIFMEK